MFRQSKDFFCFYAQNPFAHCCKRVLILLFVLLSRQLAAQYSVSANDDSNIEWRQIKTGRFQLVYPDFYEANAMRLARVLDTVSTNIGNSLGTSAPKIPILLHTNGSKSNGLLVWAPKRMELWTTPPPEHYAYPWSWQLALHEYRHACQMQALNKGITKWLNAIFGEHIIGAVSGVFIPLWFMEGDAVVAETAMSPTGRGQTPEFKMQFKAQLLEKGVFNINKISLGSRKDFVPSKYVFGYYMSAYSRHLYGKDVFSEVLETTTKGWWKGNWFTKTKTERYDYAQVYQLLTDTLVSHWQSERVAWQSEDTSALSEIGIAKKYYTNYRNPIAIGTDSILALQSSNFDLQSLVILSRGKAEKLRSLPFLNHSHFDYKDGKILYSQLSQNPRWGQQNYSDIIEYDFKNNKYRVLTSMAVFFNPVYNPADSTLIAAIQTDSNDNQSLVILSPNGKFFKTKKLLYKNKSQYIASVSTNANIAFAFPCWNEEGTMLYVIETSEQGKCIASYDIASMERKQITDNSFDDISRLKIHDGRLYFIRDVKGKYELVSTDLSGQNARLETNTEYGIENFSFFAGDCEPSQQDLFVSTYNSDGYRVVKTKPLAKSMSLSEKNPEQIFVSSLREQENFMLDADCVASCGKSFKSESYSKTTHLFNFHSWAPIYLNISKIDFGIGVSFFSQNLLSTSVVQFGYKYNPFDVKHELYLDYTYSGLYPIIDIETSYKKRSLVLEEPSDTLNAQWDELMSGIKIAFPYSWSTQRSVNSVKLNFDYSVRSLVHHQVEDKSSNLQILDRFSTFGAALSLNFLSAMCLNDIAPRFGEVVRLNYKTTLTSDPADYFSALSTTYLPFFFRNQSLQLNLSYSCNSPQKYYFPSEISFTKGIYGLYPEEFYGFSLSLHTPICYPDVQWGRFMYCKRVSMAPFFEVGSFDGNIQHSFGTDMSFNVHLLRITVPLEIGFRAGYLPEFGKLFFNFLFNLEL